MRLAAGFAAQSLSHGGLGAHFYIKNTAVKHLFVNLNEPFGGISKVSYLHILSYFLSSVYEKRQGMRRSTAFEIKRSIHIRLKSKKL